MTHCTTVVAMLGARYQARCSCGWSTVWIVCEGALALAESEAEAHKREA